MRWKTQAVAWMVSARSAKALTKQAERLLAWVNDRPELDIADVGWSLATTRSMFDHRAVAVGADRRDLMDGLAGLAADQPRFGVVLGRAHPEGKTVFVFPGEGSQWLGMGQQLYGRFVVFARAFDAAVEALDPHLRLPLRQVIWGSDAALLESTEFAQPALFAVEVALAALLRGWGVVADFVMGNSVGEIVAAHVAGVLSLADAARVVAARGRLMAALPAGGVMVAVGAAEREVTPLLNADVEIAAVNAPDAVVISGQEAAVGVVADRLVSQGRRVHRLAVSHAFHSVLMEPMLDEFSHLVADVAVSRPEIGVVSNVTGQLAGPGYGTASYWVEQVRKPVRFADGVDTLQALGARVFVQVGPDAGLTASVVTLAKDRPEDQSLVTAAGQLFTEGVWVQWNSVFDGGRSVELPTYGFVRQRFWLGDSGTQVIDQTGIGATEELRRLAPAEQRRRLVELVRVNAAVVLGYSSSHDIDPECAFQDLGFDSLTGVELRNRLRVHAGLAGLPLPRSLIFDYPTPSAVADRLGELLSGSGHEESDDDRIWSLLRNIPIDDLRRTGLLDKLLLLAGQPQASPQDPTVSDDVIDSLDSAALIALALNRDDENDIS